jgi:hypothetical protein
MDLIFFIPLIIWAAWVFWSSRFYDRILEAQYSDHRDAWEHDGKPRGLFWTPPEEGLIERGFSSRVKSGLAQGRWCWKIPDWAIDDTNAQSLIRKYRRVVLFNVLVGLPFFGLSEMLLVILVGKSR